MARLDLGLDRGEAGWPATPGIGAAIRRMTDAQDAHEREASLRARRSQEDAAMASIGRDLVRAVRDGSIDPCALTKDLAARIDATASPSARD